MHCGELNQELGYKAPEASQPLNDFLKALGHKFSVTNTSGLGFFC